MAPKTITDWDLQIKLDAAVRDLEELMFKGVSTDFCHYCKTRTCYARGGQDCCAPQWRGLSESRAELSSTASAPIFKEKYRAKSKETGEWVYGMPLYDWADCSLKADGRCLCNHSGELLTFMAWNDDAHEYEETEVDEKTVCRFVGADLLGREVYENDAICVLISKHDSSLDITAVIVKSWFTWNAILSCINEETEMDGNALLVIGNIFDSDHAQFEDQDSVVEKVKECASDEASAYLILQALGQIK